MKSLYSELPNGYQESIQKGLGAMRYFSRNMSFGAGTEEERIGRLKKEIESADAIVIGAGAGLSTAAGLTYSGERFERYFFDFANRYGIRDNYSGGFYPFPDEETRWAWWARNIYYNRYIDAPKPVYGKLLNLIKDRDYFAITTNVDHQFQRAGFDKKRLFYTQGDYGLFQSVNPSLQKTYDNEEWVMKAMEAQGFVKDADGVYQVPEDGRIAMRIPSDLIPKCPDDGSGVTMNLRVDDSFVEDEGWHRASAAYSDFLHRHEKLYVLYLELGVGANTPIIIKYPFWQYTKENPKAFYACINKGEAYCPEEIADQAVCMDVDIGEALRKLF
jgi:NAD-dependent SIR2 family protein deacetylase